MVWAKTLTTLAGDGSIGDRHRVLKKQVVASYRNRMCQSLSVSVNVSRVRAVAGFPVTARVIARLEAATVALIIIIAS